MQRSSTLAGLLLLILGMAQPAVAEKRAPKKLAITILNNGFQPVAGAKVDEEILELLRAERASDHGLLPLLKLDQCAQPLTDECVLLAFDEPRRNALSAQLHGKGIDAWILVLRTGGNPYDGWIWTFTANNRGGSAMMSYRHPANAFEPKAFLEVSARAGLCDANEEGGPCFAR